MELRDADGTRYPAELSAARITKNLLQILSVTTDRNTGGFLYMKATGREKPRKPLNFQGFFERLTLGELGSTPRRLEAVLLKAV